MKIGVLSDTHIPAKTSALPKRVYQVFQSVDMIIHAGDIEASPVLDELAALAPVHAVAGNMDHEIYALPVMRHMVIEGYRVGVMHGTGGPKPDIRSYVRKQLGEVQLIIYGHTHKAYWGQEGGIWFMNPGSTVVGTANAKPTVGLLTITTDNLRGELVQL